jgi:hypothetical protein
LNKNRAGLSARFFFVSTFSGMRSGLLLLGAGSGDRFWQHELFATGNDVAKPSCFARRTFKECRGVSGALLR